jgi:hypothetical protein
LSNEPSKINHSDNWFLNKIGNLCELIARPLMQRYYSWGTFWTYEIDLKEDIDKEND